MQGKCGGGKEVPSQAGECEAYQSCCGGFIQGSRGMTGTLCHHGPEHEALQCSHLLQLCQHIWTQTLAQRAVSGDGFVPAWAQLFLCCHKSTESSRAKMSWQQREAQWGSRTAPLPVITAPQGWNLHQKGLESLAGTHEVTFSCPQCTQLHLSHLPPHFLHQMQ